ncbi:hypothetical protein QJS83_12555 [Bdellovibrio sp. 22V]|uniref:hypothetical protein n=1 Tax=Bdellovibrio TaxID=958 RepID=UPI002542A064|nr:hypothetical protein [Bdellovibrio sp. 22V]WII71293.1 hypothetical protein QJS83_12555 [Bdellovibrio sp. 22V]
MKSLILTALLFCGFVAHAGTEVVNGGGGVEINGEYATFGSAKIPVQKRTLGPTEVPGLNLIAPMMQKLMLTDESKKTIFENLIPSSRRAFFKVDEARLDDSSFASIIREYSEIMKLPKEEVVLFALTFPKKKQTVLFPAFFQLKPVEQAAILLHEAMWVVNPKIRYDQMIQLEMATQVLLENPEPTIAQQWTFYSNFHQVIGDGANLVKVAFVLDIQAGHNFAADVLIGQDTFQCMQRSAAQSPIDGCVDAWSNQLAVSLSLGQGGFLAEALYEYLLLNSPRSFMSDAFRKERHNVSDFELIYKEDSIARFYIRNKVTGRIYGNFMLL